MQAVEQDKPRHWYEMIRGIIKLTRSYDVLAVEKACARALDFGAISYQTVKSILENGLHNLDQENLSVPDLGGYGHELSIYDNLK
jgi:hypothetical protein